MKNVKLHSAKPWFFLTGLLALVPVLNNLHSQLFFPSVPAPVVSILAVFGGIYTAVMGFARAWAILVRRSKARTLLAAVAQDIRPDDKAGENDLGQSGRLVTRLVRNAEVDLEEMRPDFSLASLARLQGTVPMLLTEIQNEEGAKIRLGIVGVYIGETLCRAQGWQWEFRADPSLRQFTYLASRLTKNGKTFDVFHWAGLILTGKSGPKALLREVEG